MCMHHEEEQSSQGVLSGTTQGGDQPLSRRGMLLRGGALAAMGLIPALGCARQASAGSGEVRQDALSAKEKANRAAPGGRWARPLGTNHPVSAAYGIKGDWLAGYHTGIDFAVNTGTPVYSVGPGTVDISGPQGDYGRAVMVRMDDGHFILYAHLSSASVKVGRRVSGGARLGSSGATGRASGPHLHFEVRTTRNYGTDINPTRYLAARGIQLR